VTNRAIKGTEVKFCRYSSGPIGTLPNFVSDLDSGLFFLQILWPVAWTRILKFQIQEHPTIFPDAESGDPCEGRGPGW